MLDEPTGALDVRTARDVLNGVKDWVEEHEMTLMVITHRPGDIGTLGGEAEAPRRAPGSIAAGLEGLRQGAQILRVHDVAETVQAVRLWQALTAPAAGAT